MKVQFKKLTTTAITPTYGTKNSAGADLYIDLQDTDVLTIKAGQTVMCHTGISVAIPEGHVGLIFARSGLACKNNLAPANKVGVIDSDYRGELIVALHNHGNEDKIVKIGDRIAQFMILPYPKVEFEEVDELDSTDRGEGGFGSTGK